MTNLTKCITELESAGLDVFEVGCHWQEKAPLTLSQKAEIVTGFSVWVASVLLLYVLNELARSCFKPPSN
ncbi:MAG: hypothetical protein AAFV85_26815 [Cyanobacteria bacterium J06634_6]